LNVEWSEEHTNRISISTVLIVFLVLATFSTSTYSQEAYEPSTIVLKVYEDGFVQVEYEIETDVTYPKIDASLLGKTYENIIVADQDGIPLDYTPIDEGVTIDTLGSSAVKITYFTPDLTSKSGRLWTLTVNTPIKADIILPSQATIISLNQTPIAIKTVDGQTLLTMPLGELEITYILEIAEIQTVEKFPYWMVLGATVVIAAVISIFAVFRFRKPKSSDVAKEKRTIDVKRILEQKPQLRLEDREAVQFIAECGGEVFEADIRKRFKLPRTTVWRMIQRLEREGVADIIKIGGQNLIQIKQKYNLKRET
jgi:uncharacterized membrane protein